MSNYFQLQFYIFVAVHFTVAQENTRPFRNTYVQGLEAPFVVLIKYLDGFEEIRCTGTLLDKNWVLTAASCVNKPSNVSSFSVYANIKQADSPTAYTQIRNISEKHVNPYFKSDNLAENDVALLLVMKPFSINANVDPITVEGSGWPLSESKRECIVYGFGDIDFKLLDLGLKRHRVSAYHANTCPCARRNQWMNLVCLDPMEDVGLCSGDLGAPMVCGGQLVAINHLLVSRDNCSDVEPALICGDFGTVSYFMYVCPYLDWLKQYVPTLPNKPAYCGSGRPSTALIGPFLLVVLAGFH